MLESAATLRRRCRRRHARERRRRLEQLRPQALLLRLGLRAQPLALCERGVARVLRGTARGLRLHEPAAQLVERRLKPLRTRLAAQQGVAQLRISERVRGRVLLCAPRDQLRLWHRRTNQRLRRRWSQRVH